MPKQVEKAVALSEFGRQVGCTSKTIERYIAAGKIFGPAITVSPGGKNKVFPSLALPQYTAAQANVQHRFARSIHSGTDYGAARAKEPKPKAKPGAPAAPKLNARQNLELDNLLAFPDLSPEERSEKLDAYLAGEYPLPEGPAVDLLLKEHGKPARKNRPKAGAGEVVEGGPRRPQPQGGNLKTGKDRVDSDVSGTENMSESELLLLDITQLTKREAVLRVMQKQLEIGKTSGELIAVEKVYGGLYSFAVEVRKRFEAMPHRIIDSLMNCKSRPDALGIFIKEVNSSLAALSEFGGVLETIKSNRAK